MYALIYILRDGDMLHKCVDKVPVLFNIREYFYKQGVN